LAIGINRPKPQNQDNCQCRQDNPSFSITASNLRTSIFGRTSKLGARSSNFLAASVDPYRLGALCKLLTLRFTTVREILSCDLPRHDRLPCTGLKAAQLCLTTRAADDVFGHSFHSLRCKAIAAESHEHAVIETILCQRRIAILRHAHVSPRMGS